MFLVHQASVLLIVLTELVKNLVCYSFLPAFSKTHTLPRSISSMGDDGDIFSLGGELLVLEGALLPLPVFICWLSLLVCCSSRDWTLLLPSALQRKQDLTVYLLNTSFKEIYHEINYKSIWIGTQKLYYLVFLTAMLLLSFSRRYSPVSWLTMRIHSFI